MAAHWKRLSGFYALTFLLLAIVPAVGVLSGSGMDFDAAGARASEQTGMAWTSNLAVVIRLALVEPTLWLLIFGSAIPSLAAVIICALARPARLRSLFARFAPRMSGRNAVATYGLLFACMGIGLLATYALRMTVSPATYAHPAGFFGPGLIGALLAAALLDQGAVLEELGWRGFAQPELQRAGFDPLRAALLVGVAWGMWHIPRDVVAGVVERLGAVEYLLFYLPSFLAGTVSTSIVAAYFVNRCHGSVLPAIVVHGLSNDAVGIAGSAAMEIALTPAHQATKALPFMLLAAVLIAITGRQLGARHSR